MLSLSHVRFDAMDAVSFALSVSVMGRERLLSSAM